MSNGKRLGFGPTAWAVMRRFNPGKPAFVSYISPSQVNVQVPSTIGTGNQPLVLTTANGKSATADIILEDEQPELLSPPAFNIAGYPYAVALFPDGVTYVLPIGAIPGVPSRPAKQGETITLYGIGFGMTTPSVPAGQIVPAANSLALPLTVTVDGTTAAVPYAGLAPGIVGLYQFNVVVPVSSSSPGPALIQMVPGPLNRGTQLYISVQ